MDSTNAAQTAPACDHDWHIWPETDGQEQQCAKCGAYRPTPAEQRQVTASPPPTYATITLQVPVELLGAIDHRAQQESLLRDAWIRIALANASASPGPAYQQDWACPECGCAHGVAGEPYWTHGKPNEVEAIWTCDRCDHEHAIPYVSPNASAATSIGK